MRWPNGNSATTDEIELAFQSGLITESEYHELLAQDDE